MNNDKKRNAVVTGASQGLGAAIAELFAAAGCKVFVNCARSVEKAQKVADKIVAAGGDAEVFQCDIASEKEVCEKFAALEKHCGGIDILINNARLDPYLRTPDISDGDWFTKTIAVNLTGAYLTTLAVIDGMKERKWGRIINVSSIWAYWPARRQIIPYSASKAGMHALTRAFANEGAPYNITVNTIVPGLIITENCGKRLTPELLQAETAAVPLGRGATAEEITQVILNTVNSGFITGEAVNVNGGAYMGN